jgi:hypothetical protein
MDLEVTIIIGMVTGILTATFLFVCKEIFTNYIVPFYQRIRYQGADVSGSWFAEYTGDDESKSTFSIVLRQSAHIITGSIQFSHKGPTKSYNVDYYVLGEYWEGYLHLHCRSKDRKVFSHSAAFLKLVGGGTGLLGSFSFRNVETDLVTMMDIGFDRN